VSEEEAEENEYGILLIEATHLDETRPQKCICVLSSCRLFYVSAPQLWTV